MISRGSAGCSRRCRAVPCRYPRRQPRRDDAVRLGASRQLLFRAGASAVLGRLDHQAQGNEEMAMTDLGLLTVELQGVNGSYLGANGSRTSYNDSLRKPALRIPDPEQRRDPRSVEQVLRRRPAEPAGGGAGAAVLVALAGRGERRARAAGRRGSTDPRRGDLRRHRQVT